MKNAVNIIGIYEDMKKDTEELLNAGLTREEVDGYLEFFLECYIKEQTDLMDSQKIEELN